MGLPAAVASARQLITEELRLLHFFAFKPLARPAGMYKLSTPTIYTDHVGMCVSYGGIDYVFHMIMSSGTH